jgi:hypothetical protein
MTIQTRQISVTISEPDGTPLEGAIVDIKLHGLGNGTGGAVARTLQTELTDDAGYCVFTLWQNEANYSDTYYTISSRHPVTGESIHRNEEFIVGSVNTDVKNLIDANVGRAEEIKQSAVTAAAVAAVLTSITAIGQPTVAGAFSNTPASSPVANTLYVTGTSPTGAWAGHPNQWAWHDGTTWHFSSIPSGSLIITADGVRYEFSGSAWTLDPVPRRIRQVRITASTLTPSATNEDVMHVCDACLVTLPASGFVETAQLHFMQWSTDQIEFVAGAGAGVIVAGDTTRKTRAQYSVLTAWHKGAGVWVLFGDMEPA